MGLKARIFVTPRKDVLDPQGAAVERALHTLGFDEVANVRLGRYIELDLGHIDAQAAESRVNTMCEKLIANPVVEDYRVEFIEDAS